MDKQKLKSEVLATIKQVVDNVLNEQKRIKTSNVALKETDKVADLGLESLELLALTEVLDRDFGFGYVDVSTIQNLTVGELCKRVVYRQVRAEVKKELLNLMRELGDDEDYSSAEAEEATLWDWGYDSMDIEELREEAERIFNIELPGEKLKDYTFGEFIDYLAENV